MNKYLLHGKLTALPGHAEELAEILIQASKLVSKLKECHFYVISRDAQESNAIWVTEIWDSKAAHDASLQYEDIKNLIMKAMPLIDHEAMKTKRQELEVLEGFQI